jgi:glutamate-ammonia-ligase adenylyltransferase
LQAVWLNATEPATAQKILGEVGYREPTAVLALLDGLRAGGAYQSFSAEGRARMDRLVPLLLAVAGLSADPLTTLTRLVNLLEAIGRRSTYFALLIENPMALSQLVKLLSASPWIANWIAQHPILLDELLDPRSLYEPLTRERLVDELRSRLAHIPAEDEEMQMEILREFRHGRLLRVAAADIARDLRSPREGGSETSSFIPCRLCASVRKSCASGRRRYRCQSRSCTEKVGAHLAAIADVVIGESLDLAQRARSHRATRCASLPGPGITSRFRRHRLRQTGKPGTRLPGPTST